MSISVHVLNYIKFIMVTFANKLKYKNVCMITEHRLGRLHKI